MAIKRYRTFILILLATDRHPPHLLKEIIAAIVNGLDMLSNRTPASGGKTVFQAFGRSSDRRECGVKPRARLVAQLSRFWAIRCLYLRVNGRDVGATSISKGRAQPYLCGTYSCPPR